MPATFIPYPFHAENCHFSNNTWGKVVSGLLRLTVTCDQIVLCRFRSVWCSVQIAMHLNVCFTMPGSMFRHPMEPPKVQAQLEEVQVEQFLDGGLQKQNYYHLLARSPIIFTPQKDEINQVCKIHPQIFPYLNVHFVLTTWCNLHLSDSPSTTRFHPMTCFPAQPCPLPLPSVPRVSPPSDATEWSKLYFFAPLYLYLSIYLPIYQPINQSIYLPICLSICHYLSLSVYLSIYLSYLPIFHHQMDSTDCHKIPFDFVRFEASSRLLYRQCMQDVKLTEDWHTSSKIITRGSAAVAPWMRKFVMPSSRNKGITCASGHWQF